MAAKKARRAAPRPHTAPMEPEPQPAVSTPIEQPTLHPAPEQRPRMRISSGALMYLLGLIVAIIAGAMIKEGLDYWTYLILAVLGFVVAFMNITEDEATLFLLATVTFVISTNSVRGIIQDLPVIPQILANMIIFTSASAFIISLKEIVRIAKNK